MTKLERLWLDALKKKAQENANGNGEAKISLSYSDFLTLIEMIENEH